MSLVDITMHGFEVVARTYLFWNAINDNALKDLHEKVLLAANPLRPSSYYNFSPRKY
jgi:hypothetical protein